MADSKRKKENKKNQLTLLKQSTLKYPQSPEKAKLETFTNAYATRDYWICFNCPEFTALCPITGQPDLGTIRIKYIPNETCIESKSLKLYLFSFRNYGAFHEAVVNRILEDVITICNPRKAIVTGDFNARGGISISVTAEHP